MLQCCSPKCRQFASRCCGAYAPNEALFGHWNLGFYPLKSMVKPKSRLQISPCQHFLCYIIYCHFHWILECRCDIIFLHCLWKPHTRGASNGPCRVRKFSRRDYPSVAGGPSLERQLIYHCVLCSFPLLLYCSPRNSDSILQSWVMQSLLPPVARARNPLCSSSAA